MFGAFSSKTTIGALLVVATLGLSGCGQGQNFGLDFNTNSPTATDTDPQKKDPTQQSLFKHSRDTTYFYRSEGKAIIEYKEAVEGTITYLPLDSHKRATGAYGRITQEMYLDAKGNSPSINHNPSGWQKNKEVTITDGEHTYNGWFYNRSHLIADSLGGNVSPENLVTGTRMQNVGWNNPPGGMAYMETKIRDFLKENDNCSVYYAVTPNYRKYELVPRTVTVEAQSCDKTIDERIVVDNVAPGFTINYATGEFNKKG